VKAEYDAMVKQDDEQVREAGKVLKEDIVWEGAIPEHVIEALGQSSIFLIE
jgi:hypothetical protein